MRLGPDEQPPADLGLARHTIDLMAMLQVKTRGNLSLEEQRLLENSLTLLRFRYVQMSDESKKAKQAPESQPTESQQPETNPADSQKA